MTDPFRFKPARKRPGIYFNTGDSVYWCQHGDVSKPVDEKLIKAIRAAKEEFYKVLRSEDANQA